MNGSIRASIASKAAQGSTLTSAQKRVPCTLLVELLARNTGATASCLVAVESPRGAKLRLELKAIPTSDLAKLIRSFAAS